MFKHRISRRARVRIVSFSGAALLALSLFSAVCWGHLRIYRRQTAVDADRAFEETVNALNDLSASLQKSRYAGDGAMAAKVCAEIYADAGRAGTALAALPFSTVEMERFKHFISLSGDYAYTLCREAAEQGFSDEQRGNMVGLSERASEIARELEAMRGELRDGALTMDSREARIANIPEEEPAYLSARMGDWAAAFPEPQPLEYHGQYSAQEEEAAEPVDEEEARRIAATLLDCEPEEAELAAKTEDGGRLMLSFGTRTVTVTAAGLEQMRDSRLISESSLSHREARAAAEEALRGLGIEGLRWEKSEREGNCLRLFGSAENDGAAGLDREIAVEVALDDGAICSLDLSRTGGETAESGWALSEWKAMDLTPPGLLLQRTRKVTLAGADGRSIACWELRCLDERGGTVRVYLNADSGRQEEILIG